MHTQYLHTFIQAALSSSFTRAAKDLNYSQSTVTMHIQRLEEELGFSLFEKIGRKNYLTPAGEAFLPTALEITSALRKAEELGKHPEEMEGTLRVGTLESLAFAVLLDILPRFRKRFPKVNVQIKIGNTSELLQHLRQNNLDLVYVSSVPITDEMLLISHRRRESICFVAGENHPLKTRETISFSELLSYPLVLTEPDGYLASRFLALSAERGLNPRVSIFADNLRVISDLLEDQENVSFFPQYYAEIPNVQKRIIILPVDLPEQNYYSQLLYHKNKWVTPYMKFFIGLVQEKRPGNIPLLEQKGV